jgi:hypothetical protein
MAVALEREIELFKRELPGWLTDPAKVGQYVLIGGDPAKVVAMYPTFEAALAAGYEEFELGSFLVKQVVEREEPRYFSRNLRCPT